MMDKAYAKLRHMCPNHPDKKVEFLQVDNLDFIQKNKNLFCCSNCLFSGSHIKIQDYQIIDDIIKSKTDEIFPKWPPLNNDKLLDQLIKITIRNDKTESIIAQIEKYFIDLKIEILKQIDISHKKMIQLVQEIPQNKIVILNRYTELSKINELRSILSDNNSDIHEKNRKYRALFDKILSEKKVITEQLTSLLNQCQQKQTIFNSEASLDIKQSILKSISNINLFQSLNNPILNHNNQSNSNSNNTKQMKLDISLIKTDFYDSQNCQEISINQNNQYQVKIIKEKWWQNTVSNILLQRNKKYIMRIEIQNMSDGQRFLVGLMKDININTKLGFDDYLSCYLHYKNNQVLKYPCNCGINNVVKGNGFTLSKENVIEMRISIDDQILEVLDYPNYQCKLSLQDQYKSILINQNLRLYLGMAYLNNTMILKEAFIVDQFD